MTKTIRIKRDTIANGEYQKAGSVIDVDPLDALRLVGYGKAEYCDKSAVQVREPVVENRDPVIASEPAKPKRGRKKGK